MTKPLGAFDEAQGSPNLEALQFLGKNMKADQVVNIAAMLPLTIDVAGNGGLTFPVPFDCEVVDIVVHASGTSGSGTVTLSNDGHAVSNAIIMAADKVVTRAASIDPAYSEFSEGDDFTLTTNGSGDRGTVRLVVVVK